MGMGDLDTVVIGWAPPIETKPGVETTRSIFRGLMWITLVINSLLSRMILQVGGGTLKIFGICTPIPGEIAILFDSLTNIFQWKNKRPLQVVV